jgi:type II pantothenate kinase
MTAGAAGSPFCKLADPSTYVACRWELDRDAEGRGHWVPFFKRHFNTILHLGVEAAVARGEIRLGAQARADLCREEFNSAFDAFDRNPTKYGRVTILTLDTWRDSLLRRHGFVDPFVDLKNRENENMLPLLPRVCRELDELRGLEQLEAVIEGVFAGNIFDMGADATAKKFLGASPDFFHTRDSLAARPWLMDDYDALAARLLDGKPYRQVVYFLDNAGSDFLLGVVPMVRWLAQRGTRVVLAANDRPTLNDMTIADVRAWWPRILAAEPSIAGLPIELVGTGTGEPLIDLGVVSDELNKASASADLVVLEGMGRGIESNLDAEFSCDCIHLAMIKDEGVARRHGGKVFDVCCRFRPAR